MNLKIRIEVSNCFIMSEQNNIESFGEESCNEEVLYKKILVFDFSFLPLIENHLFSCAQIIILFEEFGVPYFFQSFTPKLGNPRVIFLCAFIIKSYNFLK